MTCRWSSSWSRDDNFRRCLLVRDRLTEKTWWRHVFPLPNAESAAVVNQGPTTHDLVCPMQPDNKHDEATQIYHLLRMWLQSKQTDGTLVPTNGNSIWNFASTNYNLAQNFPLKLAFYYSAQLTYNTKILNISRRVSSWRNFTCVTCTLYCSPKINSSTPKYWVDA